MLSATSIARRHPAAAARAARSAFLVRDWSRRPSSTAPVAPAIRSCTLTSWSRTRSAARTAAVGARRPSPLRARTHCRLPLPRAGRDQHRRSDARGPSPPARPRARVLVPLIERGQAAGKFRRDVPVAWHLAMRMALIHAGSAEVRAGAGSRGRCRGRTGRERSQGHHGFRRASDRARLTTAMSAGDPGSG